MSLQLTDEILLPQPEQLFKVDIPSLPFQNKERHMYIDSNMELYVANVEQFSAFKRHIDGLRDNSLSAMDAYTLLDNIQSMRHDFAHIFISTELACSSRESPVSESMNRLFRIAPDFWDHPICNKTPDIFLADELTQTIYLIDVAVTVAVSHVSNLKTKKYQPVADYLNGCLKVTDYNRWHCRVIPAALDQNLTNIDVILSPLKVQMSRERKAGMKIWVTECNELIAKLSSYKLTKDPKELKVFYELKQLHSGADKGGLVYPIPKAETLDILKGNDYYEKAKICTEFERADEYYHCNALADHFKKFYDVRKLYENQSFIYPSPRIIKESMEEMESLAKDEFNVLNKPKPSVHFMMALTQQERFEHEGNLDLLKIDELKTALSDIFLINRRPDETTRNLYEFLQSIRESIPNLISNEESAEAKIWNGSKVCPKDVVCSVRSRATIDRKIIKNQKMFFEKWAGIGKKHEDVVTKVESLAFWEPKLRKKAEDYVALEGIELVKPRSNKKLNRPVNSGIQAVDTINNAAYNEVSPTFEHINNMQASYVSKQISNMCYSIMVQRKREANHVQIINKGDRGMFIVTLPHRMLETRKEGNTVPYFIISLRLSHEKMFNSDLIECSFKSVSGKYIIEVSKAMRLDVQRIDSLSSSYELFNSVAAGWIMSTNDKVTEKTEFKNYYKAVGFLFFLCHSVHIRTGGLLDNLRYMFMDVTAEKSNFREFMIDNGKMALKNYIQVALYSRMKSVLPEYAISARNIVPKEPTYDTDTESLTWGSLGVLDVSLPSLICPGYKFNSFMAATNEIIGLFFAVPKDLHGAFHKKVNLERTPFDWQVKFDNVERHFLDVHDSLQAIENGGAEFQQVDLRLVYEVGRYVDQVCLEPRAAEFQKELGKLRLSDSILNHKQFTSSHSCIRKLNDKGYIERTKVLLRTLEVIDTHFNGNPPSLWEFCLWSILHSEPFRFVISPKGQRTMTDREIYIGNMNSFALRTVEKVFSVVCRFQTNESIHIAGDRKFIQMQSSFKELLDWCRSMNRHLKERTLAKEKLHELNEKRAVRFNSVYEVELKIGKTKEEAAHIAKIKNDINMSEEEQEIFDKLIGKKPMVSGSKPSLDSDKIKRIEEMAEYEKCKQILEVPAFHSHVAFLNGDRTKWSAADVCHKFLIYIDALKTIPKQIRLLCKAILLKHDDKFMHISQDLHERNLLISGNEDNAFKVICGTDPYGKVKGNWFQGMLNFTSSSFHAGTQELSWELLRTRLLRNVPLKLIGLCHSDDEAVFIGYGLKQQGEENGQKLSVLEENPLETILLFHEIMGSLGSMNYSKKKTNVHLKVSEFVSLFLIWGDQQFPFIKHLATAISGLPGTGLDDDMYAALAQIMMAAMRGCPLSALLPVIQLSQERIDRMYSLGKNMTNDVESIFHIPRQYLPLELGGKFLPGPLPLMLAGPAVHDVMVLKAAIDGTLPSEEICKKVKKCFYALSPHGLIKTVADDDPLAQEEHFATTRLSGFTGMIFKNYMPKKKDELLIKYASEVTEEKELEFIIKHPSASVMKPGISSESLTYWKLILSKPSWVRAMRKEGARGMAIKRAQWVKGEHVKLRYDEEFRPMKECLEEISDYVNSEEDLTYSQEQILQNYVENVSSSIVSYIDWLSNVHVSARTERKPCSVRIASFLNKPYAYRDVQNDIRKLICYIWDIEGFTTENRTMKYPDSLADDIAKIKRFHEPSYQRKTYLDKKFREAYKEMRLRLLRGIPYDRAFRTVCEIVGLEKHEHEDFKRYAHSVYTESSWVYKQFEEQSKTRVVISTAELKSLSTPEKILCENCLRWSTMFLTTGRPLVRMQPTAVHEGNEREAHYFRLIIDTIGHMYKKLVFYGIPSSHIREIFEMLGYPDCDGHYVGIKDWVRRCAHYLIASPDADVSAKKLIAVVQTVLYNDTTLADNLMETYNTPIGAWIKEQVHTGRGNYTGPFEYICWIKDSYLRIIGSDTSSMIHQNWTLSSADSVTTMALVRKAYKEMFKHYDPDLRKLEPRVCDKIRTGYYVCRIGSNWKISKLHVGVTYIPSIKIIQDTSMMASGSYHKLFASRNGLELWQRSRFSTKHAKMVSIRRTATKLKDINKIMYHPATSKKIYIDNLSLEKLVELKQFSNFLEASFNQISLSALTKIVCPREQEIDFVAIKYIWGLFSKSTNLVVPEMPKLQDVGAISANDYPEIDENPHVDEDFLEFMKDLDDADEDDIFNAIVSLDDSKWTTSELGFQSIDLPEEDEYDVMKSRIDRMTLDDEEEYMSKLHSGQGRDLYDPIMFRTGKLEIYKEQVDDAGLFSDKKTSSGDSKVEIRELLSTVKGKTLGEKTIIMNLELIPEYTPSWRELFAHILSIVDKRPVLKQRKLMYFPCFIWGVLCRHIINFGMNGDDTFHLKDRHDRKSLIMKLMHIKEESGTFYSKYDMGNMTELMTLTYDYKFRLTDFLDGF